MDKKDLANNRFDSGYNCAQSVLTPFARQMNINLETALKLSSGFGAGKGRIQGTCGALTGAYMVLGLKYGKLPPDEATNEKIVSMIQDITHRFESEHGFTNCRDLLNVDLKTTEGQIVFRNKDLHSKVCSLCVNSAVSLLEEIIDKS